MPGRRQLTAQPSTQRALHLIFVSRHGWQLFSLHTLAAFGLLSGVIQLVSALWAPKTGFPFPWWVAAAVVVASAANGLLRAWPRQHVSRQFALPDTKVRVTIGDLFDQNAHLVVGMSDTFDTDTTDNEIINARSVLGQYISRIYGSDRGRLDRELENALQEASPIALEATTEKTGKLRRYPIGTVAVLGPSSRRTFAVAHTRMGNDLIARGTVDDLWQALNAVWNSMHKYGQRGTIAIPIIGGEFARISCLDKESLLKMSLLSFVARSREDPVCSELIVVVYPTDADKINMLEVAAYLRSL